MVMKNYPLNLPPEVADVAKRIFIRLHDPRWFCTIVFIYSERNGLALYLARLGGERCQQLYTFTRPIGAVEELMNLDLGLVTPLQNTKMWLSLMKKLIQ